jgi:hypothetical protein
MSCSTVIPGRSWSIQKDVTVSDTVNNLMMDDMPAGYLHNAGSADIDATIGYVYTTGATGLVRIPAGQFFQLSPHSRRVMSTGTTGGATLKALW